MFGRPMPNLNTTTKLSQAAKDYKKLNSSKVYTAPKVKYKTSKPKYSPPKATPKPKAAPKPVNTQAHYNKGYTSGVKAAQNTAQKAAEKKADARQKKLDSEAIARSKRENAATAALVSQQKGLLKSFGKQRDVKLGNIKSAWSSSDKSLLSGYTSSLRGLRTSAKENDKSEADSTFQNVSNAVRERGDVLGEISSNGGGETDVLRGQLASLRNYTTNQNEINRSFFDTLGSVNRSITSLNVDTSTSRNNLWNQAEADRESAWANYYNQMSDTNTQITNIENSNTNVKTDSSVAYNKTQKNSGKNAATYAGKSYKKATNTKLGSWSGKGAEEKRKLTSGNRSAIRSLAGPMKRAEGATLRKW